MWKRYKQMKIYTHYRIINPDEKCEIVLAGIDESIEEIRIRLQIANENRLELIPVLVLKTGDYLKLRKEAITHE